MNKYNESKIYKISSPHTDKIYIGSTAGKYLSKRINSHKSDFNKWNKDNTKRYCSSYVLYELGNVEYELLELYNCNNNEELTKRERYWMELHSNFIVNVKKANRTKEESKEYDKKWAEEHKEERKEYNKEHYEANKEKFKEYYEEHKDHKIQLQREYRQKNRDMVNQKRRECYAKKKALKATQQI